MNILTSGFTGRGNFRFVAVVALVALLLLYAVRQAPAASAHGKELTITVSSLVPDPAEPLTRLYRVRATYAGDGDPIDGATVTLLAEQVDGGRTVDAVELTEVKGESGLYVGEVKFTRFGRWNVVINVKAMLGLGSGETVFEDNVRPGNLSPAEEAALESEGERVRRLQIFFQFGLWPDLVNIIVRITHSFSGLAYFGTVGFALTLAWFGVPARSSRTWERVRAGYLPVTMLSLAGILGTGMFSMAYDAPVTAPGIYDLDRLFALPYGEWYFAAFVLKPVAWVGLVALAIRVYFVVVRGPRPVVAGAPAGLPAISGGAGNGAMEPLKPVPGLRGLTLLTIAVGLALVADLAVVIYLHYLSHLGVFLPS